MLLYRWFGRLSNPLLFPRHPLGTVTWKRISPGRGPRRESRSTIMILPPLRTHHRRNAEQAYQIQQKAQPPPRRAGGGQLPDFTGNYHLAEAENGEKSDRSGRLIHKGADDSEQPQEKKRCPPAAEQSTAPGLHLRLNPAATVGGYALFLERWSRGRAQRYTPPGGMFSNTVLCSADSKSLL